MNGAVATLKRAAVQLGASPRGFLAWGFLFAALLVGVFFTYYGTALILSTTHSKMTVTRWPACVMYLMIPVAGVTMIYFVLMKMLGIEDETDAQKKGEA